MIPQNDGQPLAPPLPQLAPMAAEDEDEFNSDYEEYSADEDETDSESDIEDMDIDVQNYVAAEIVEDIIMLD